MLRSTRRRMMTGFLALLAANAMFVAIAPELATAAPPDGRAFELVSPPDKNGGDIIADTQRTRAAADGNALGFESLAGFAGAQGTGISTDYVSVRSSDPDPGNNGWSTHGILPPLRALSPGAVFARVNPHFQGEFSPDLDRGILFEWGALDGDPSVDGVANLYRGTGLRGSSGHAFDLVSSAFSPLPAYPDNALAIGLNPFLADTTPDLNHVAFESVQALTADAPAQPPRCNLSFPDASCRARLYEWDNGTLSLAGRVPVLPATECSDASGPACVPADVSLAEQGTGLSHDIASNRTPHAIGVDRDGHVRVFFTQPTDGSNETSTDTNNSLSVNRASSGRIFMRVDGTSTVQLNASERTDCADHDPCTGDPEPDATAPAQLLDASADGTRVFFTSGEALTDDAVGGSKLYMYDTTKPPSAPDNLTFISPDNEPIDGTGVDVLSTIGVSNDGHYVYFVALGQMVRGAALPFNGYGIYLWHDGNIDYVGAAPVGVVQNETITLGANWGLTPSQARITPDGRHLLFATADGSELLAPPYDQGSCPGLAGGLGGCREMYVYSLDGSTPARPNLACASCNPSGATAATHAAAAVWTNAGAALTSFHRNHAISDDGSRVFFTTGDALVPADQNGRLDAYEWTADGTHGCQSDNIYNHGCLSLLSSGVSTSDSYFMDASPDGSNAFVLTRERLVGWDVDDAYDLYDARIGRGFPEPPPTPVCSDDRCQGDQSGSPVQPSTGTALFEGAGNLAEKLRAAPTTKHCRRGFVRKRVRGKVKCVKKRPRHHRRAARSKRARHAQRRAS